VFNVKINPHDNDINLIIAENPPYFSSKIFIHYLSEIIDTDANLLFLKPFVPFLAALYSLKQEVNFSESTTD